MKNTFMNFLTMFKNGREDSVFCFVCGTGFFFAKGIRRSKAAQLIFDTTAYGSRYTAFSMGWWSLGYRCRIRKYERFPTSLMLLETCAGFLPIDHLPEDACSNRSAAEPDSMFRPSMYRRSHHPSYLNP